MNIKEILLNHFRLAVALMSLLLLLLLAVLFGLPFSVFQHKTESPSLQYETETIEDLHIGEEFLLSNYYITSQHKHHRFYQIDENNVLTGYGKNDGSVWWWGKLSSPNLIFQTTSEGLLQREPEKSWNAEFMLLQGLTTLQP